MIDWTLHIDSDPEKLFGKPLIFNTRITVDLILEKLAIGDTIDDLIDAYPNITRDYLIACFWYCFVFQEQELFVPSIRN